MKVHLKPGFLSLMIYHWQQCYDEECFHEVLEHSLKPSNHYKKSEHGN